MKIQKYEATSMQQKAKFFILAGFISMATLPLTSSAADTKDNVTVGPKVPTPKLQKTIDLSDIGSAVMVKKLSFSPDGHYLAIVVDPEFGKTDIVVWDMEKDKKQSHIHCPYPYGGLRDHDLLWMRDGKVISFGAKRQWNPLTGEALSDNPAIGRGARLNKDGTKMLTIVGTIGDPSTIHIYDTTNWQLQKLYVDGLAVESAAWTAEDKILVGAHNTKETLNTTIDGYTITHGPDVAIRLIDPKGKEASKGIWFPAIPDDRPNYLPYKQAIDVVLSVSNFETNMIALGAGRIIDGKSLRITTYYSIEDIVNNKVATGTGGMVFDPSGKFLYLKNFGWYDNRSPARNSIIDTLKGKELANFTGGFVGIAMHPDGNQLAIGDVDRVLILNLQ